MTPIPVKLSTEGYCVAGYCVEQRLKRAKGRPMVVDTLGDKSVINGVLVSVRGRQAIADSVTGTLYDEKTGRCWSSVRRVLVGDAPKGWKPPPKTVSEFCYGTQPVGKNKSVSATGKRKGTDLTKDEIAKIMEKRRGTACYVLGNVECQQIFRVSKGVVDGLRRSK